MPKRAQARATRGPRRKPGRRSSAPESVLLRAAESLGRVIAELQRQVEQTRLDRTSDNRRSQRRRKRPTGKKRSRK
jgi:hypothetical protein